MISALLEELSQLNLYCPANWRQTTYLAGVAVQQEVLKPWLRARVEEGHRLAGHAISGLGFHMLVQIARAAAPREIIYGGATTPSLWGDVIDLRGPAARGFGIVTVLTAIASAACHLGAIAFRCGHGQPSTP
jgi:hypothetical protein